MPVLGKVDQAFLLGGGNILYISGGYLENMSYGVLFVGNDGTRCFFNGVSWTTDGLYNIIPVVENTAYQWNGTIHIDYGWAKDGFNVYNFAHEFGHYLQQEEMGTYNYLRYVAYPSMYNLQFEDGYNHNSMPYETDATSRGIKFFNTHKYKY